MCKLTSWACVTYATTGHMPAGLACEVGVFREDEDEDEDETSQDVLLDC